jgi:biopolymer transport protein ExbD
MSEFREEQRVQPHINVTPLIDVLLVLLIIFMVVTPLKPSRFEAKIPSPPRDEPVPTKADINTLVVEIKTDGSLKLNSLDDMGTVNDTGKLSMRLSKLFQERLENRDYAPELASRTDLPEAERVQKTVFIKAPRAIRYGEVAKVIDGIKGAGANPVGLQVDDLN